MPDFVIIGAMKCATSSLHVQLAQQPGFFMSTPKEPNFFSDEAEFARGMDYYAGLFRDAPEGVICGESSTHYTKLPTHPHTVARLQKHLPEARFIYVMRDPMARLVSQYIHEWTQRTILAPIDEAVSQHPELIAYGQYTMQLEPYLKAFGPSRVLPVFFEALTAHPQEQLERVCAFLGYESTPLYRAEEGAQNVSSQRLRKSPLRDFIVNAPGLKQLRRALVPQSVRNRVKSLWSMKERPMLSPEKAQEIADLYDADLSRLGGWMGVALSCETFARTVCERPLEWRPDLDMNA